MKRPETYHEWRDKYQSQYRLIGGIVRLQWVRDGNVRMTRDLWKTLDRIRRIGMRLDAEREAKTASWKSAVAEFLTDEIFGDGEF